MEPFLVSATRPVPLPVISVIIYTKTSEVWHDLVMLDYHHSITAIAVACHIYGHGGISYILMHIAGIYIHAMCTVTLLAHL